TGKTSVGATPEAAEAMLGVILKAGGAIGFKAAGGIRSLEDAAIYMDIAERHLGADWVTPAHFRIGASKLLDVVLAALESG
ncbi:MAG: deoxyribose-phosphate aldolase, partial [Kiloniellales bacterium]|nr:deoxyribose-phosphate aldolase [Kiloniellales bacterium]